ncbi:CHAT domain-containing protein [Streptomyces millisiae]|uniref:CHAT domain-containing protein n=1 Tax=Streptomyces millisiae TaxID=3075542 RepID=A0ABU2LII6_9ACTN|nr:CHAT domain-containing protein [Streptomyces sp. DSM 44918]MDT0316948.1 CHAT domain-containing protein [Streptomyces sp. DSM 44918]
MGELRAALLAVKESAAAEYAVDLMRDINLLPEQLRELDQLIDHWSTIVRLLPEDAPPLVHAETALGMLLAARATADASARPDDRAEALRRLRRTDRHGEVGGELAVAARMALLRLLVPGRVLNERAGSSDAVLREAFTFGRSGPYGPRAPAPELVEACGILDRLSAARLPFDIRQRLDRTRHRLELVRRVFSSSTTLEDWRLLIPLLPEHVLRAGRGFWEPPEAVAEHGHDKKTRAAGPPHVTAGDAAWDSSAALDDIMLDQAKRGDLEHLEGIAARMRQALHTLPEDDPAAWWARLDLAHALSHAGSLSGVLQDDEAADELRRTVEVALNSQPRGLLPDRSRTQVQLAISRALQETGRTERGRDGSALPGLIDELTRLHEAVPANDVQRHHVSLALGNALIRHGYLTGDLDERRAGSRYLREAVEVDWPLPGPYLPLLRSFVLSLLTQVDPDADARLIEEAVAATHGVLAGRKVHPDREFTVRHQLGQALLAAAQRGNDPRRLEQGIAELAMARELAAAAPVSERLSEALSLLAQAYAARSSLPRTNGVDTERAGADREAALTTGRAALVELAADVLRQLGSEHGLETARRGADLALWMAHFAAAHRRGREFHEALELGRAMVLRAAAVSQDMPRLLADRGHPELAEEWRRAEQRGGTRPRPAVELLRPGAASGPSIPSTLRRRALTALGARTRGGDQELIVSPGLGQLKEVIAAAGVDALVYLVPGRERSPGYALLVRPTGRPTQVHTLSRLSLTDPALRRYLDAAAARSRPAGPEERYAAEARWRRALEELCDWAWQAAIEPVLASLEPLGRPPRVVLVPCDRLGVVPWHAARRRNEHTGSVRYACQDAVFSYAPSALELMRAASRRRLPLAERQVLLADPEQTLLWSSIEVEALRAAYYPNALLHGGLLDTEPDAPGTPDDLLAVLPGGRDSPASLVHLSCHALAGRSPTRSALRLDGGELTVARLLDFPPGETVRTAGPLVVLGACETDLSSRDHDEALTLATALVARGAADVVGSRWAILDSATAVLMAVFHHHLTADGLAPADALRAAQLWMLDPDRQPPSTLTDPDLRREATRPDLHHPHFWAAFTHQGNPTATRA